MHGFVAADIATRQKKTLGKFRQKNFLKIYHMDFISY